MDLVPDRRIVGHSIVQAHRERTAPDDQDPCDAARLSSLGDDAKPDAHVEGRCERRRPRDADDAQAVRPTLAPAHREQADERTERECGGDTGRIRPTELDEEIAIGWNGAWQGSPYGRVSAYAPGAGRCVGRTRGRVARVEVRPLCEAVASNWHCRHGAQRCRGPTTLAACYRGAPGNPNGLGQTCLRPQQASFRVFPTGRVRSFTNLWGVMWTSGN